MCIQTGIVPIDYNDIHVPGGIISRAIEQQPGILSFLVQVEQSL